MDIWIIDRQWLANNAAERWKQQYCYFATAGHEKVYYWSTAEHEKVYDRLRMLGSTPNPDDVDRVIRNKSWTSMTCTLCRDALWPSVGK